MLNTMQAFWIVSLQKTVNNHKSSLNYVIGMMKLVWWLFCMYLCIEKGQVYKQKRPTMYPPWNSTFDAHVHRGRVMHVVIKDKTLELKTEATVQLDTLASRCKKENGKLEIWVSMCLAADKFSSETKCKWVQFFWFCTPQSHLKKKYFWGNKGYKTGYIKHGFNCLFWITC